MLASDKLYVSTNVMVHFFLRAETFSQGQVRHWAEINEKKIIFLIPIFPISFLVPLMDCGSIR
jgi:hypothetical protein